MTSDTPYKAPRHTPHPDETPLSPYDSRELETLDETPHKRALLSVAKSIQSTEANLEKQLRQLGKPRTDDLRDVTINVNQIALNRKSFLPAARKAKSAQNNLDSHYQRWAALCEKHLSYQQSSE